MCLHFKEKEQKETESRCEHVNRAIRLGCIAVLHYKTCTPSLMCLASHRFHSTGHQSPSLVLFIFSFENHTTTLSALTVADIAASNCFITPLSTTLPHPLGFGCNSWHDLMAYHLPGAAVLPPATPPTSCLLASWLSMSPIKPTDILHRPVFISP